jgi:hypothetical protein
VNALGLRELLAGRLRLILIGGALILLALSFRTTIRGDGIGYYSYLPTLVARQSIDVRPTFDRFLAADVPVWRNWLQVRLPNGLTADFKPVGSAELALPFYAAVQVALAVTPAVEDPVLGTLSQFAFTAASLFLALVTLILLFQFVAQFWGRWPAGLAVACVLFATPLVDYVFYEPAYSHTFSLAMITIFAVTLYRTGLERNRAQWFLLGVVGGILTITHVQEFIFLALIPAEAVVAFWRRAWSPRLLPGYGLFAAGVLLGVAPQIAIDRLFFQRWLPASAPNISFDFLHPRLLDMLFSTHHGWLSWTPLVVLALVALPLVIRRLGWFAVTLALLCVLDVYLNASLSDWWGGSAFGARRLTDQSLLLALGFGAAFAWLRDHGRAAVAIAIAGAAIVWNTLLLANLFYVIARDAGPPWPDFLLGQFRGIPYLPRLFAQGFVIRGIVFGQPLEALGIWLLLAAVLAGAIWFGLWIDSRQARRQAVFEDPAPRLAPAIS